MPAPLLSVATHIAWMWVPYGQKTKNPGEFPHRGSNWNDRLGSAWMPCPELPHGAS